MADKRINDLTAATRVDVTDLFVLEQAGAAKKLTGQVLIEDLAEALDGHGGIADITYAAPAPPNLAGTLSVELADGTYESFPVTNGNGVSSITSSKTGLVTTITVTMDDETTYSFAVGDGVGIDSIEWEDTGTSGDGQYHIGTINYSNGTTGSVTIRDGVKGDAGDVTNVYFKWSNDYPAADSDMLDTPSAYIGICATTDPTAPTSYTAYSWYQYKGAKGDTGSSIRSIAKTSTSGLTDVYTVTMTDGATSSFQVTNAKSIVSFVKTSGTGTAGTTDVYTITFNDGDTSTLTVYNGANGLGSVSSVSGIQADGNGDVPQVVSGNGAPTTATPGQENQLYYDLTNSVLYYCAGESGGTYSWFGAGVTVDSALSNSSENPVQNKVITSKVGTVALNTTATNLSAAINEVLASIPIAASTRPPADTTFGAVGVGSTWARADHSHPINVASGGRPSPDGIASYGTATTYAQSDHVHPLNVDTSVPAGIGATASTGSATTYARRDHVHPTPCIHLSTTLTSLPVTISNSSITSSMRVIEAVFGTPSAMSSALSWTTADGSVTFSGTLASGKTTTLNFDLITVR